METIKQDYNFVMVKLDELKPSKYNPPHRTSRKSHKYASLRKSIGTYGLLQPPNITNDFRVIDGHRRIACCSDLGVDRLMCIMHNGNAGKVYDSMFVTMNEFNELLSGNQWLYRWINNTTVPSKILSSITLLNRVWGVKFLKAIYKQGKSPTTYASALSQWNKSIGVQDEEVLGKFGQWMLTTGSAYRFKNVLHLADKTKNAEHIKKVSEMVYSCIMDNVAIPLEWTA